MAFFPRPPIHHSHPSMPCPPQPDNKAFSRFQEGCAWILIFERKKTYFYTETLWNIRELNYTQYFFFLWHLKLPVTCILDIVLWVSWLTFLWFLKGTN